MLGKRPISEELLDDVELPEVVTREVKRRRKVVPFTEQPTTLNEKRAMDRGAITKLLKENRNLIIKWDVIMEYCLEGKESKSFLSIKSIDDFIDGFELSVNERMTGAQLQRKLRDLGLDVLPPKALNRSGIFWV